MELYIIRHGETDFNKRGIVQGRGVNSDLNEMGQQQARSFYKAYHHIPFDRIYTSSLKRTHQTVEPFINKGIEWVKLHELDELDWGVNEGREATAEMKKEFQQLTRKWMEGDLHLKFPGGESPIEVNARQKNAIQKIISEPVNHALICMHGRALRLILCELLNIPLSNMDTFPHSNVSLYRLKYSDNKFEMLDFNNTDHFHV
ncbi:MAG: histidine phosphatase family protein [bacterium]|jgi:broad specificity phosphatase PhoE